MKEGAHNSRDTQVYEEAAALWRELYGEPPPIRADGGLMLDIIMKTLPAADYDRILSPHLRPSTITRRVP
jgi:hypothetical protein